MNIDELIISPQDKNGFFHQIDDFYSRPFPVFEAMENELRDLTAGKNCFEKRAVSYEYLAEHLQIEVFSKCPFAAHYSNKYSRADVEMSGISYWYSRLDEAAAVQKEFYDNVSGTDMNGLAIYYQPVDNGHLTIDYESVLNKGINGILKDLEGRMATSTDKRSFFLAAKCGLLAHKRLAQRFSALAAQKAAQEIPDEDRSSMTALSEAISRVPAEPAQSFYEALCAIVFLYFTTPALDGGNVSVFGHVDRLLAPYLQRDISLGRITYPEAFDYIWRFIYLMDSKWGKNHMGTNSTITIGGCDSEGKPVFNDVTRMIITAYRQLRCIDPKLNIRMSKESPAELVEMAASALSDGLNNICIFNDDVIISANCKAGKKEEDCRLYVGGGCQENVLAACEMNSRATIYMNSLPALFCGWHDDTWARFLNRFNPEKPEYFTPEDSFEQIYQKTLHNLRMHITAQVNMKNISEAKGLSWCASPAHSALLGDCLQTGRDMYDGGARYSSSSVALVGTGTLIDSLMAIKWVVFDQKLMTLEKFIDIVKNNFEGNEPLRQQIINKAPKYTRDDSANDFAATFFKDASRASAGLKNTRGGKYEPSLFAFRSFTFLGASFPATPDGRRAGEYLSAGMSPTLLAHTVATDILASLKKIDLTDYPVVAVLDLKLPPTPVQAMLGIIKQFISYGGSVLQINVADQQTLLEAKEHPERHPDLIVRMSGYSARFSALTDTEKDEVINRTVN